MTFAHKCAKCGKQKRGSKADINWYRAIFFQTRRGKNGYSVNEKAESFELCPECAEGMIGGIVER